MDPHRVLFQLGNPRPDRVKEEILAKTWLGHAAILWTHRTTGRNLEQALVRALAHGLLAARAENRQAAFLATLDHHPQGSLKAIILVALRSPDPLAIASAVTALATLANLDLDELKRAVVARITNTGHAV